MAEEISKNSQGNINIIIWSKFIFYFNMCFSFIENFLLLICLNYVFWLLVELR